MPRIRSIKPTFWDDIKISKLSRDARLLFIGIWNFSDDLGVIIADKVWIKSKIFPYDSLELLDLGKWLEELLSKKFIVSIVHNSEEYFFISNFKKHQRIDKPNYDDVHIDNQTLNYIKVQSNDNPRSIQDQSKINQRGIGEDRIGEEGIGGQFREFSMIEIFNKKWDDYRVILNGQSKHLSELLFIEWKEFVVFIRDNGYSELFQCKFISPIDWGRLQKEIGFPKDVWKVTIEKILGSGIKPEHNLYFRIPQFLKYGQTKEPKKSFIPTPPDSFDYNKSEKW